MTAANEDRTQEEIMRRWFGDLLEQNVMSHNNMTRMVDNFIGSRDRPSLWERDYVKGFVQCLIDTHERIKANQDKQPIYRIKVEPVTKYKLTAENGAELGIFEVASGWEGMVKYTTKDENGREQSVVCEAKHPISQVFNPEAVLTNVVRVSPGLLQVMIEPNDENP